MAKFPTIEEMAQNAAEKALDEYEYKGKTLREWVKIIAASELSTNLAEVGTDCISRRAAIDAAIEAADDWDGGCNIGRQKRIEEYIRRLPPAEPKKRGMNIDQEKMIVEALPSLYPLKNFEEEAIHAVLDAIPHWIPVTERLPAMGKSVLICDAYGDICLGHRTSSGYYFPDFCEDKVKDVRAWMPLPEPYKGVTE